MEKSKDKLKKPQKLNLTNQTNSGLVVFYDVSQETDQVAKNTDPGACTGRL